MQERSESIALEFAGFWRRLGAYFIDLIILSIGIGILSSIWGLGLTSFWNIGELFNLPEWATLPFVALGSLLSLLIEAAYFVAFWVWRGQTPGKMALSMKLIRTDGSKITLGTALLRYLGYIVSTVIFFIGFIWIAFDSRKQGLHDKMADTYVVKIPQPPITVPSPKPSVSV